jgi:hypothetical protein
MEYKYPTVNSLLKKSRKRKVLFEKIFIKDGDIYLKLQHYSDFEFIIELEKSNRNRRK